MEIFLVVGTSSGEHFLVGEKGGRSIFDSLNFYISERLTRGENGDFS